MLGEKIGEMSGKINSQRVLANPGGGPKMETSFQASGTLLGTDVKETGTYSHRCPPGRHTVRRRARSNHDQGRENGHLDRPRCRHD